MTKKSTRNIKTAFILNLSFSIVELIGGVFTNSTAIIADALHDFCDSLSIAAAWFLEKKSEKKPDEKYTYGYARFSVLGALISSVFLLVSSILVICLAVPRIINPEAVNYEGVLLLAVLGVIINGLAVYKTAKGQSLNEKAINLHLLEDVLTWVVVLAAGIAMKILDLPILDPILSVLIAVYILFKVVKNLKSILEVFLEKAPSDIDMVELKQQLLKNQKIKDIHHVHLWTLDGMDKYATLHVTVRNGVDKTSLEKIIIEIKEFIRENLREHKITHSSIEVEFEKEECDDHECHQMDAERDHHHEHLGHYH